MNIYFECPCQTKRFSGQDTVLWEFESLREECLVLKEMLIPDQYWPSFKEIIENPKPNFRHQSIILGAFKGNYLKRITFPFHRYLFEGSRKKADINDNYSKDLIEHWMDRDILIRRHRKSREYQGKFVELLIAAWLEEKKWNVNELGALGGKCDIEATSPDGNEFDIEVKLIGQEDDEFEEIHKSCEYGNGVYVGNPSLYAGFNFLIFKIFDAALQLSKSIKNRLALIVISNMTWHRYQMQVKDIVSWMGKRPIEFYVVKNTKWNEWLSDKKNKEKRYSNIENELDSVIGSLQEIWFVRQSEDFEYSLEGRY